MTLITCYVGLLDRATRPFGNASHYLLTPLVKDLGFVGNALELADYSPLVKYLPQLATLRDLVVELTEKLINVIRLGEVVDTHLERFAITIHDL
jgi:hypothetical protein